MFLLSDVRLYREGLRLNLAAQPGIDVAGAGDFTEASIARVLELRLQVVVLDMGTPAGFDIARRLGAELPTAKIVAFAISEVDDTVLACAEAGVAGYVAPDGTQADLVRAIECAIRGELYCSPRIAGVLFRRIGALAGRPRPGTGAHGLTRREQQILDLVGKGLSNKEIARALRISSATVKNHVHNVLEKLQVHRRNEAAMCLRQPQAAGRDRPSRRDPSQEPGEADPRR